jgi:molybdopterin-containing oxidoreductase family iron-sulfur binding subunit
VDTLVISGWNPAYAAPFDLNFGEALLRVPNSVYRGLYVDETAARATWFLPATHPFEDWADARGHDGTTTFVQPLVSPLFSGIAEAQMLAAYIGEGDKSPYTLLRDSWRRRSPNDSDRSWDKWISDGLVPGTSSAAEKPQLRADAIAQAAARERPGAQMPGLEVEIVPDSKVWDGRFANNAWLQELPDPVTKLTWDNAALVSPKTAKELGVETHDLVDLGLRGPPVHAPIYVQPGQADGVVTVSMGYGRGSNTELIARGVGFDVAPLRRSDSPWSGRGLTVLKLGRKHPLAITQEHWAMEGRDPAIDTSRDKVSEDPRIEKRREPIPTAYPPTDYSNVPYKWGMAIDLGRCTGCNACVVACQSENNVPVVGKVNVQKSREMHWLRIDRYYEGPEDDPRAITQPMMCVHCEYAPCEYVCPVNATVHSDEGLNEMAYNRCIGTRYCSNNCPYKVRRFNYFNYTYGLTSDTEKLRMNPDVTVRSRGVMEKCTYCVQRIERARIDTRVAGTSIRDGQLQTACQEACPARAIVFGNLNDRAAEVTRWHADERHYYVLHELNTRPRTAYLARVRNPNPELA